MVNLVNQATKSALFGAIGAGVAEALVEAKKLKRVDPTMVAKAAMVGAIIAPAQRVAAAGLRSALGLRDWGNDE